MLDQLSEQFPQFNSVDQIDAAKELVGLEHRLERGWQIMTRAEERGEPTDELFSHFTLLLSQYQMLYDRRKAA